MWRRLFGPPSRDKVARMMMSELQRLGVPGPLEYDAEEFRITPAGDRHSEMFLDNLYTEYCSAPRRARRELLRRYAMAFHSDKMPQGYDDAAPTLLPQVRDRSWYEFAGLHLRVQGRPPIEVPQRHMCQHLAVAVVCNLPRTIGTLPPDLLRAKSA